MTLEEIKTRMAELQKQIDAIGAKEIAADSLLTRPDEGRGYYYIGAGAKGFVVLYGDNAFVDRNDGNIFLSLQLADKYADALNTLLLLRHQQGTTAFIHGEDQSYIELTSDAEVTISRYCATTNKLSRISPAFSTTKDAQRAIDTIGADRILRMFRTLHHCED